MHDETKRLIRERAERIGRLATDLLLHSDTGRDVVEALKWSWLILRRPRSFLERFRGAELRIDADELETFIWRHQEQLFGAGRYRLLPEELQILDLHKEEVERLDRGAALRGALPPGAPGRLAFLPEERP
jgi:hypothetical protein